MLKDLEVEDIFGEVILVDVLKDKEFLCIKLHNELLEEKRINVNSFKERKILSQFLQERISEQGFDNIYQNLIEMDFELV